MNLRPGVFVLLALLVALVVACGDDDDAGDATPATTVTSATQPATEVPATGTTAATATEATAVATEPTEATATAATAEPTEPAATEVAVDPADLLLSLTDLPEGWLEDPPSEEESPLDECQPEHAEEVERAEFGAEGPETFPQLSHEVIVFETAEGALTALAGADETLQCAVDGFNAGLADTAEVAFSDASVREIEFPAMGDESGARRIELTLLDAAGEELGVLVYDVVYVISGRLAFSLEGVNFAEPIDSEFLVEMAEVAYERLQ